MSSSSPPPPHSTTGSSSPLNPPGPPHHHRRPHHPPRTRSGYTNPYPPQSPACVFAVVTLFLETPLILLFIGFLEFNFSMYGIGRPGGRRAMGALIWVEISAWIFTVGTLIALWVQYIMVGTDNITPKRVFECQLSMAIACLVAITLEVITLFLGYSKEGGRQRGRGGDNVDEIPGYIWLTSMVGIPFFLGTVGAGIIWYFDHASRQAALAQAGARDVEGAVGAGVVGGGDEGGEEEEEERSLVEVEPVAVAEGERQPLLSSSTT